MSEEIFDIMLLEPFSLPWKHNSFKNSKAKIIIYTFVEFYRYIDTQIDDIFVHSFFRKIFCFSFSSSPSPLRYIHEIYLEAVEMPSAKRKKN